MPLSTTFPSAIGDRFQYESESRYRTARKPLDKDMANIRPGFDENGRFAPGNQVSRGHAAPKARAVMELRTAFLEVITPEEMAAITRRHIELIKNTKDGKTAVAALALLYERLWGKPRESIEVTTQTAPAPALNLDNLPPAQREAFLDALDVITTPARVITAEPS